jgi:hypothetical protein
LKKTLVILLLFLFILQCGIKTIIVTAFFVQRDYISKTLCENRNKPKLHCNGKCYLNKQLKKEEKNEQNLPGILKANNEVFIHTKIYSIVFFDTEKCMGYSDTYLLKAYQSATLRIFRPPSFT